ncbi:hypothetical protein [Olivibacter sitiensis]|uniref:hypothetical protein n=1 Tax=Olivibacter sitiensis TaxID=376470 RepID=UPI0012F7F2F3|nr:hypothetical protein [Olivibacter sitiensis]
MINDRTIDEKQVRGCFIVHETEDNIVEISLRDSSETFSMHYVKPKDSISGNPYIPHLDVKTNGSISAWTQDKGHVIYYQEKDKSLAFSFSDDTTKDNRVSGILVFQQ